MFHLSPPLSVDDSIQLHATDRGGRALRSEHSSRYAICSVEELPPGTRRLVKLGGREIGVFNVHGEFFAIRNRCPHQGGPLCRGMTTGRTVGEFIDGGQPALGW